MNNGMFVALAPFQTMRTANFFVRCSDGWFVVPFTVALAGDSLDLECRVFQHRKDRFLSIRSLEEAVEGSCQSAVHLSPFLCRGSGEPFVEVPVRRAIPSGDTSDMLICT